MVSPLDIEVVIVAQGIHDNVWAGTSVKDISQNVKHVNGKPLYQVAESDDEVISPVGIDDGADNDIDVGLLVGVHAAFMQQLLNDVGELFGQSLAYFRAGIFGRYILADSDQLVQGNDIPVYQIFFCFLDELQLFCRIVDEGAEFFLFCFTQGVAENFVHFAFDGS